MNDNKKIKLQDLFSDYKLMTIQECFDDLGWEYKIDDKNDGYKDIKCCGENISTGGWIGIEHANCKKCKKGMQNMTGALPAKNAVQFIDSDKTEIPEDGRIWATVNFWG